MLIEFVFDLKTLNDLSNAYNLNLFIGYLNISLVREKVISFRDKIQKFPIDVLCVHETKLDEGFPDSSLKEQITISLT